MYPQISKFLLVVTVSSLTGCTGIQHATDLTAGFQLSNPFSKASQFQKLVNTQQLSKAEEYYNENRHELQSSPNAREARDHLAQILAQQDETEILRLVEQLPPLSNPQDWPKLKMLLAQAERYTRRIETTFALQDSVAHRHNYTSLKQAVEDKQQELLKNLQTNLIAFIQSESGNFSQKYPAPLNAHQLTQLSIQSQPQLADTIKDLPINRAQDFVRHNHAWMEKRIAQQVINAWIAGYAKQQAWKQPITLAQRLDTLKQIGLENQLRLAIVSVGGSRANLSTLNQRLGGTEVAAEANLTETNRKLQDQGYDLALYIKPGKASGSSRIQSEKPEAARYIDGEQQVPNPELASKREELQRVEEDLNAAYSSNAQLQQQAAQLAAYGGNYSAIGALTAQASNYAISHGQQKAERLRQELAYMPVTIAQPAYKDYHRLRITHQVDAQLPIHYLLVDLESKQAYRFEETLKESRAVSTVMAATLHPRDTSPPTPAATDWTASATDLANKWPTLLNLSTGKMFEAVKGKSSKVEAFKDWLRN